MAWGLFSGTARAAIAPDVQTHCRSQGEAPVDIEIDVYFKRLHPMAGVRLFGIMKTVRKEMLSLFPVEVDPLRSEMSFGWTLTGTTMEPAQRMERQAYSLEMPDEYLKNDTRFDATLHITTDSANPFGSPESERIFVECVSTRSSGATN